MANIHHSAEPPLHRSTPKGMRWTGWALTFLIVLMLGADAVFKFIKPAPVVEGTVKLGFSENVIVPLGAVLLTSVLLFAVPRTAVLGAILLTGYLGGAVATHVRAGDSLFGHILVPVYVGVVVWLSLWLRDARLRELAPFRMGHQSD